MKNVLLGLIAFIGMASQGLGQYDLDYGVKLGASNYLGDIGGDEKTRRDWILDMKLPQTSFVVGGFLRYRFYPKMFVNVGFEYGRIRGNDQLSTNPGRRGRNLHFRNDIKELSVRGEYAFYSVYDVGGTGRYLASFKAYAFAGGAVIHHNPKAQYNGEWVALRPLKTEGQAEPYPNFAFSIPKGVGFYFTYKKKTRIGWEIGWRSTFTDYLDDISTTYADPSDLESEQARELANRRGSAPPIEESGYSLPPEENYYAGEKRGDPTHDDSYIFTTFNLSYVVRGRSNFYRSRYGWLNQKRRVLRRRTRTKF